VIGVSESGLKSREELDRLAAAGYRAFLIGERFMTDPDPAGAIRHLVSVPQMNGVGRPFTGRHTNHVR
jgi:indole-3-glycerol phosphate synthase